MANYVEDKRLADDPKTLEEIKAGLASIGASVARTGTPAEDRSGIDLFVDTRKLDGVRIDVKVRGRDYGQGDLALESWSIFPVNGRTGRPGWTVDPEHQTDAVLWFFTDTKRFVLIAYRSLRSVATVHLDEWRERFGERFNKNETLGGYESAWIPVPISELEQYMKVKQWTLSDN